MTVEMPLGYENPCIGGYVTGWQGARSDRELKRREKRRPKIKRKRELDSIFNELNYSVHKRNMTEKYLIKLYKAKQKKEKYEAFFEVNIPGTEKFEQTLVKWKLENEKEKRLEEELAHMNCDSQLREKIERLVKQIYIVM